MIGHWDVPDCLYNVVVVGVFFGVDAPDVVEGTIPVRAVVVARAYNVVHFLRNTETVGLTHLAVAIERRCIEYSSIQA